MEEFKIPEKIICPNCCKTMDKTMYGGYCKDCNTSIVVTLQCADSFGKLYGQQTITMNGIPEIIKSR